MPDEPTHLKACAHADTDGRGMHFLKPGDVCRVTPEQVDRALSRMADRIVEHICAEISGETS